MNVLDTLFPMVVELIVAFIRNTKMVDFMFPNCGNVHLVTF